MTVDIALALLVLVAAIGVLVTGLLRMDVVAITVLVLVATLGLVSPETALAGFSNSAVLTVAGMYVISAGLSRTGVATWLGRWILRMGGGREARTVVAITLVSGLISGFMNNVGVAAMMLPVVVGIARRTDLPPSKLLIPMALGAQLGGFLTLIGTTPNILASDALRKGGYEPFGLFSFTPLGLILLGVGTAFVALAAPRLLPDRVPNLGKGDLDRSGIRRDVELSERLFHLTVPHRSPLDGRTLGDSLIDSALGVHVLAVRRGEVTVRAPGPEAVLRGGDRILVQGRPDFFLELRGRRHLQTDDHAVSPEWLESPEIGLARALVAAGSRFEGRSAADLDLQAREGLLILTLRRGTEFNRRTHFVDTPLRSGDELLLQGPRDRLAAVAAGGDLDGFEMLTAGEAVASFQLGERLWSLRVTPDSLLAGRALAETRLGDAVGFRVLAVGREGEGGAIGVHLVPGPSFVVQGGDHLLVKARPEDMVILRALQRLEVDLESPADPDILEGADAGFVEVVLAPRSALVGRTLRQVNFRGRFGLHVVAIVRQGGAVQANLREEELRFGDALLLYGSRRHHRALLKEPDLIALGSPEAEDPSSRLAPRSLVVTALVLGSVLTGFVPVAIGVLAGASLMVLTRCLTPDEAYRSVDWPTLVLVAGMDSLGAALSETGAVDLLGKGLLGIAGGAGPPAVLAALVLVTAAAGQIVPGSVAVVLMAPIAVTGAEQLDVSPHAFVLAIAIAATSLVSPVSHPAHALVMAPAGYRISDFLRLGLPLTILVLVITIVSAPLFFPF